MAAAGHAGMAAARRYGTIARCDLNCRLSPWRFEVLDRAGGGDSFASGLIYGLLEARCVIEEALGYGVAHGGLAMTTPGDTSMATATEVERLATGEVAHVARECVLGVMACPEASRDSVRRAVAIGCTSVQPRSLRLVSPDGHRTRQH